ncbi:2-acylglycerol O-acyltransferase 1-like [Uloborus diversus]|uniref:2-acylglycerol O-acyltransferase 1-like n=1 Tax=Uloborus diversus TaxID=327109 RepID=UPI00240A03E1|nr:2-acylglycerol O-acyltransferase 1-like [Uloborus diversus]XP_054721578.1 2-acylglycerol O-acyltransferase 1-like [Uloborus diversus]
MKILGIEFAPLMIPIERRLQTASVFYYCTNFLFFGFAMLFLNFYLLFTSYFFIPLSYLIWYIYDRKRSSQGGRRSDWFRRLPMWKYFADYFPIKMVKTADLDPNKNYIFGYHPHGIFCYGAFACFGTEATNFSEQYPGITARILTLEGQFMFPFHREHIMCSGVCAASKESIEWNLTREGKGNALVLVVGGAAEALDAHPGSVTLVLKRRKGFVKLALKHGASLVPVFAFGENDIFEQVKNPHGSFLRNIQEKLKVFLGFSTPLIRGRGIFQYSFGVLPYRKPIHVIIGQPIDVEKISEPTQEDVDKLHQLYVDKLTDLFNEHKVKYGPDLNFIIS